MLCLTGDRGVFGDRVTVIVAYMVLGCTGVLISFTEAGHHFVPSCRGILAQTL